MKPAFRCFRPTARTRHRIGRWCLRKCCAPARHQHGQRPGGAGDWDSSLLHRRTVTPARRNAEQPHTSLKASAFVVRFRPLIVAQLLDTASHRAKGRVVIVQVLRTDLSPWRAVSCAQPAPVDRQVVGPRGTRDPPLSSTARCVRTHGMRDRIASDACLEQRLTSTPRFFAS